MTQPRRFPWQIERPSRWRRLAFPLTFLAGGLSFIVIPALMSSHADAKGEIRSSRSIWAPPPGAREIARVNLLRASEMRGALERLEPNARGVIFSASEDQRAQFILNRRTGPSEPELHADWDDILIFQNGLGVLHFGGHIVGARHLGETERRGGQLVNAFFTEVEPGDVIRVPAAVPHQIESLGDAPLVYLVMKLKAPLEVLPVDKPVRATASARPATH